MTDRATSPPPRPGTEYPLFPNVGIPTFLRSRLAADFDDLDADVVVIGIPTDEGSPYKPGARFAPRALREHSLRLPGPTGYYDPQSGRDFLQEEMEHARIVDAGDLPILPTNVADTFENITVSMQRVLAQGALPVVLGGDHAVPYPVVRAYQDTIHVIQLDAHLDYEPFTHGLTMTNGQAFRHISHMRHVASLTQIGIRGIRNSRASFEDSLEDGNRIVRMGDLVGRDHDAMLAHVPEGARCYVSIDIDVLDMSLIPGCVSGEPDGMSYPALRGILAAIAERTHVVGFDLCEVNPMLDVCTGTTSYLGAYTIVEFLGAICSQPRRRPHGGG